MKDSTYRVMIALLVLLWITTILIDLSFYVRGEVPSSTTAKGPALIVDHSSVTEEFPTWDAADSIASSLYAASTAFTDQTPNFSMTFGHDERNIGVLSWKTGKLIFEGEADASAKVFFECVKGYIDTYIYEALTMKPPTGLRVMEGGKQ